MGGPQRCRPRSSKNRRRPRWPRPWPAKSKKKKWSKGKVRDQVANKVLFDEDTYARLLAEVPKMKLITPSALVERLKINGALARAAIKELQEKGMIKMVSYHHTQWIFTRDVAAE